MKSVGDCLNFYDSMILCGIEKHVGVGNLDDIRSYMKGLYNVKYIEEAIAMTTILS